MDHLFQFSPKGYGSTPSIGMPDEESDDEDAKEILLSEIFTKEKQKYTYIYDFGDDWVHAIELEKITPDEMEYADCMAGKGACPPEDCGGPWGYQNMLQVLADKKHPEYKSMKEWLGLGKNEEWNVNKFDLKEAKKAVRNINDDEM